MSTLLTLPTATALEAGASEGLATHADEAIRQQVWTLLAGVYPPGKCAERRVDQRFPLPHLIYLNPLDVDGISPRPESVVVVGKHLSERGLGFFHPQPLPHRRMIVSLETPGGDWIGFLIDITWCRFTLHGWYESGGRFLQAMPSPVRRGAGSTRRGA